MGEVFKLQFSQITYELCVLRLGQDEQERDEEKRECEILHLAHHEDADVEQCTRSIGPAQYIQEAGQPTWQITHVVGNLICLNMSYILNTN